MAEVAGIGNKMTIEQMIASQATNTEESRNTGELGKDDFLQLLITQVQNQDPLNPSTDTEFIAQLAQFSSLEQMQNLNKSFSYSMGFSLMGKFVSGEVPDDTTGDIKYVNGIVESVRMMNGEIYAVVGEDDVPIDRITDVYDTDIINSGKVTDYSDIIGMLAKSNIRNSDGETSSIEGLISTITKEEDGIYAKLDEVEIMPYKLDIGSFENEEEYVKGMVGKEVTLRFEDEVTGSIYEVTGTLCDGYIAEDDKLRVILNSVEVPADSIFAAKKVDLLSTEQLLLSEILKELQKQNSPEEGEPEEDETETEPVEDVS